MFAKVLVANRGEIAVRIVRACHDLGIEAVAIYSDLDANALHVRLADEAYNVGPGPAARSYLNVTNVLDAAERSGADAVHPGYGFLSENGGFARAVEAAGLAWVGPSGDVIDAMGDKTAARATATAADVPVVPGSPGAVTTAAEVETFAAEHGLPIAIKASAGGGGKGFRVVHSLKDIPAALTGAAREAEAYFSSPEVYLERYLERPRHIEIQVLADTAGNVLSFPERDCSLQRRHQKLIEESPSPVLGAPVRAAMMAAAVKVSKQAGYTNAGTCEFLLDADQETFYFLEMNTRLQVEHPVTELVTGIDLVHAQLAIAAGDPLALRQEEIDLRGHAIECRINAEDPANGFMPAPGRIGAYREPSGPGIRVDSGAEPGADIPPAYDPLIGKLIAYGATREEARRRMLRALAEYEIEGIRTTIPFHRLMLSDERFVAGTYHTGTVEQDLDLSLLPQPREAAQSASEPPPKETRRLEIELDGKRFEVVVRAEPAAGTSRPKPPKKGAGAGAAEGETLVAPMQGTIIEVLVEEGQEVAAGDPICVLEAMKMENSIVAHTTGTVTELKVTPGASIEAGATIATIR